MANIPELLKNLFNTDTPPTIKLWTYRVLFLGFVIFVWRISHKFIVNRFNDLIYVIKKITNYFIIKSESFRIELAINHRIKKDYKKTAYPYKKIIIKPINFDENSKETIESKLSLFKRSPVLVLNQTIHKKDRSRNLAKLLTVSVVEGLLANTRKYLTPEISMAINNVEIKRQLIAMGDYIAESYFNKSLVVDDKIKDIMQKLIKLNEEGHYTNVFIPCLSMIDKYSPVDERDVQEMIFPSAVDYSERCKEPFSNSNGLI